MKTFFGALAGAFISVALVSSAALAEEAPVAGAAPTTSSTTTPTTTPTDNAAQGQGQTQTQEGDDKIVCKKEPPPVGSRMGARKICRTVAEWRRISSVARETTGEIQSRRIEPEGK